MGSYQRGSYVLQVVAGGCTLWAWGWIGLGLWTTRPTEDLRLDLEGGGGFATSIGVYLPYLAASAVLAGLSVATFVPSRGTAWAALCGAGLAGGFAGWVLRQGYLLDYLPGLRERLMWVLVLSGGAAVCAAAAVAIPELSPAGRESATRTSRPGWGRT